MGRAKKFESAEARKEARREYQREYQRVNREKVQKSLFKHWAKKLTEAGFTVISPGGVEK